MVTDGFDCFCIYVRYTHLDIIHSIDIRTYSLHTYMYYYFSIKYVTACSHFRSFSLSLFPGTIDLKTFRNLFVSSPSSGWSYTHNGTL